MSNNKKDNNNVLSILVLLLILLVVSSLSYALWQIALNQTDKNKITTSCFKITFKDKNEVNLTEALPITDEVANALVPYEFTLLNTCSNLVEYQINLEILNDTTIDNFNYIKAKFQEKEPSILTTNKKVESTLNNAIAAYKIETGYLTKNEEKTFKLRLWLSDDAPTTEEMMNKVFTSKVTIITSYKKENQL